ncbi:MAG TPA: hypothetical protein VFR33_13500 [Candidatus Dormibacteraeota bacterium]|nr:hypothetical protein [Candidatus Dormibacteraeota bacterium]
MKRVLFAAVLAAGVLLASPASAGAYSTYCDWDPLVLVVTPAGNIVPMYDSVWTSSLLDLGLPVESTTTSRVYGPKGVPETAVTVTIYTPTGLLFRYATTDEVTSGLLGSGTVYARGTGYSGSSVTLKFIVDTP